MKWTARVTEAQWQAWQEEDWSMLPYIAEYSLPVSGLPSSWRKAWEDASPYAFLLESAKGGRYTYLSLNPVAVLEGKGEHAVWNDLQSGEHVDIHGQPLTVMNDWIASYRAPRVPGMPFFSGGFAGYLGYDVARSLERLPNQAADDTDIPDYVWMRVNELWIYDHEASCLYCAVHMPNPAHSSNLSSQTDLDNNVMLDETTSILSEYYAEAVQRAEHMLTQWMNIMHAGETDPAYPHRCARLSDAGLEAVHQESEGWKTAFSQQDFEHAVKRVQEYIAQGDVFQVNLSIRQQRTLSALPENIYEWLRLLNPSPYMGMLRMSDLRIVSGSPELLVKLEDGRVSARPIAGTRRRGLTPDEDAAMAAELLSSEKERAEHIMLVDLERNDIGRIAEYGSVHVPELLTVEYYSHVMHLVSQVEGKLAPGRTAVDVIAATFPGGTITGAPKVRTMEIIEELEPVRRGPYTGSLGWIDYNGNMELNIIIRTLAVKGNTAYLQTGAGIVIDSDPYREYRECWNKARAVMKAVQCGEEEAALSRSGITGG
ncbi:anthranilate synthase component I family protein [Paenibacillus sp. CMAA1739]|uniref:anthranilate synthase component I family protein n=1 Tax=Paenibacillus ottowii TaxID=2315729 RepID=UPI002731C36A|nr:MULTISPECIES: anthranilate synthase component I family protein [Paenibacillus]MDP1512961.1 anthranilate synthase component I family protein [Paenibacillus ottowii]MEC4568912.1 anthranilate synthase component I family protein [Paenibacillus sp. CMAA1739]